MSGMDCRIKRVKNYDRLLHRSLISIFRSLNIGQIEKFLCRPENAHRNYKLKPILKPELISRYQFSKEEFERLSLLWITVLGGCKDSAELLVRYGANVNEPFGHHDPQVLSNEWTVLNLLIQLGNNSSWREQLIRLIVDHGADLQAQDDRGKTVLHYAVMHGAILTEIFLEKGANPNIADNSGRTPVLTAASNKESTAVLPLLIKYGADITVKDSCNRNALHYLAFHSRFSDYVDENLDLSRALLEKGVSLNDKDSLSEYQPIHKAAFTGKNELVKLFLDYGADVNAQTNDGCTPLSLAVRYSNNAKLTETLVKRGANIGLKAHDGRTALHTACLAQFSINMETHIRILLSAGADVLDEDNEGNTPFSLMNRVEMENSSIRLMIKMLALKKACLPEIVLKDESIIDQYEEMSSYYRKCVEEIDQMKLTKIAQGSTFFELLSKRQCQIAALMRNPEVESNFRQFDLSKFPTYAEDVVGAFERAKEHYHSVMEQEDLFNEAFYGMFPWEIVRKMVQFSCQCCENVK